MNIPPSFSIVIPLYNKENSITRVVKSILNQTYQNFEIVIVNDGSTDKSLQKLEIYNDTRIRIINKENEGVSIARNVGIFASKNEWICLVDADDPKLENFLYEISIAINLYPKEKIFATSFYSVYNNNKTIEYDFPINNKISKVDYLTFLFKGWSAVNSSNTVIHRNIFMKDLFRRGQKQFEDFDFFIRIYQPNSIVYINKALSFRNYTSENRASENSLHLPSLAKYYETIADVFPNLQYHKNELRSYVFSKVKKLIVTRGSNKTFRKSILSSSKIILNKKQFIIIKFLAYAKIYNLYPIYRKFKLQ